MSKPTNDTTSTSGAPFDEMDNLEFANSQSVINFGDLVLKLSDLGKELPPADRDAVLVFLDRMDVEINVPRHFDIADWKRVPSRQWPIRIPPKQLLDAKVKLIKTLPNYDYNIPEFYRDWVIEELKRAGDANLTAALENFEQNAEDNWYEDIDWTVDEKLRMFYFRVGEYTCNLCG